MILLTVNDSCMACIYQQQRRRPRTWHQLKSVAARSGLISCAETRAHVSHSRGCATWRMTATTCLMRLRKQAAQVRQMSSPTSPPFINRCTIEPRLPQQCCIQTTLKQGAYSSGKPGKLGIFLISENSGKFEIYSGNFWISDSDGTFLWRSLKPTTSQA